MGVAQLEPMLYNLPCRAGAEVTTTASFEDTDYLKLLGANTVIDYKKENFQDAVKEIDLVLDLVGGEVQEKSFSVLKKGGLLIATNQLPDPKLAEHYGVRATMMHQEPSASELKHIALLFETGKLKPAVAAVLPLNKAATAWKMIAEKASHSIPYLNLNNSRKNRNGQVVLEIN